MREREEAANQCVGQQILEKEKLREREEAADQ